MKNTLFLTLIFISSLFPQFSHYQAGDHELAIIPTAYTMEKGQSYITDYELWFLNYSYAISNQTHISAFSLFPISSDFIESVSIGLKHK